MAYSDDQWAKVRALYEVGKPIPKIIELADIKDRASIYRKAKTEGWVKGKNATLVQKKVEAKQTLTSVDSEIATKSDIDRNVINEAVAEQLQLTKFFRGANMMVAKTVASKVQRDGMNASYQDLNSAAHALGRAQVSVLGKSPDTVIVNTTNAVQNTLPLVYTVEELRAINEMLESQC